MLAWGTDPTFGMTPQARAVWERLGARFITARPVVRMAYTGDRREGVTVIGDEGNRLKDWFTQWPESVVFLRPDRFVGAICSPQGISETTMAFARALGMEEVRHEG